jgi:hypothetical protein
MKTATVARILGLAFSSLMATSVVADSGNGGPSGPHYNLNIIGVPKDKSADMNNNSGHRIFVKLSGQTKIYLAEGDDYQVLDANGTDGDGASFQLPNPDPENDGTTAYSVWGRALGKPGGGATMTSCALDTDDVQWCSTHNWIAVREAGKRRFENVSRELLYVYVDLDGDGTVERYNLFDEALQEYYWQYDNNGLKLVQLRFYEIPAEVQ